MTVGFFSGGIASFLACVRVRPDVLLFSDTGIEDEDLYRFLKDASSYLGVPLVTVRAGVSFRDLILKEHALSNNRMPFCSRKLKHEPARKWIEEHAPNATLVFGIDWTEAHRAERIAARWPGHEIRCPMTEKPYLTKPEMVEVVRSMGLEPPRLYKLGFAHNNCGGGMRAWYHLYQTLPERYNWWIETEQLIPGHTFCSRTENGAKVNVPLAELPRYFECNSDQLAFDWGGCGCFIDDLDANDPSVK